VVPREITSGAAKPGADVEETHAVLQPEPGRKRLSCSPAAQMELVERRQVVRMKVLGVFARCAQCLVNPRFYGAQGVMMRNVGLDGHGSLPAFRRYPVSLDV
jgi:hypothetical protein